MDENKFTELIKNDNFIDELLACSSREEMRAIFENYNQTVSEEELDYFIETVEKALQAANSVCSDKFMEFVAGGTNLSGENITAADKYNPIDYAVLKRAIFNSHHNQFKPL